MNKFWSMVFNPLWHPAYRMLGRLPHQQLAKWRQEVAKLHPARDEAQEEIDWHREQEQSILTAGAEAAKLKNRSAQKQEAEKLVQCRREIRKAKAQHSIYDQQMVVLETRIHNATIKQTSQSVQLPAAADLTREAADAELAMRELTEVSNLAAAIEVSVDESVSTQEEEDILAEFEAMASPEQSDHVPAPREEQPTIPLDTSNGSLAAE